MNNTHKDIIDVTNGSPKTASKTFMSNVFTYMFIALILSGVAAYIFGTNESMMQYIYKIENGIITGRSIFGYITMFAPLGLVLLISGGLNKMSTSTLIILFLTFAVLMGISLSSIFLTYSITSIYSVFFISAAMFAFMAIVGYTTKTDLTKFGSLLMMALFGLIIASIVNWFAQSSGLEYIISFAGVLIFTGLTAYDVQKLKELSFKTNELGEEANKFVIMGALNLYLDFINLFLFLLRLFGGNRD